ncbi:uncharacterized protein [Palaemon carinicauda]|uniref:uncharacterized protein n=1 Tax=Palaemon carinicauda TaxID=392227 RepID=UPI0035B5AE6E
MCEVNSCCCLSLRQGCIIIGGITILVSLIQTLIFSWVLVETYQSYQSSINYQSSVDANSSMDDSSASTYSFDSPRCPFGFLAISGKSDNESFEDGYEDEGEGDEEKEEEKEDTMTQTTDSNETTSFTPETPTRTSSRISAQQASPLALELTLEEDGVSNTPVPLQAAPSSQGAVVSNQGHQSLLSSSPPSYTSPSSINGTLVLIAASSSASATATATTTASFQPMYASSSNRRLNNATRGTRVKCAAQGQGLLWALVVASALYTLVGILLIFAILYCVSWQLSIWFFYTVGYNLFTLIVAMMDGNYTNPPDISSYVVCVVMMYCVSIVDSYYEKQLLEDERVDKSGPGRRRSSVVIVRSSPDTPTPTQQDYIPPTTYRVNTGQSLSPPTAHSLAPPIPAHMLAPPTQKLAHPVKLVPPPARLPASQAPLNRSRENHHLQSKDKYRSNL